MQNKFLNNNMAACGFKVYLGHSQESSNHSNMKKNFKGKIQPLFTKERSNIQFII